MIEWLQLGAVACALAAMGGLASMTTAGERVALLFGVLGMACLSAWLAWVFS